MLFFISAPARMADHIRIRILRTTTLVPFLRKIYVDRPLRLTCLHIISLIVQIVLAVFFAIPVLLLGPFLLGLPHLLASFSFSFHFSKTNSTQNNLRPLSFLAGSVIACIFLIQGIPLFGSASSNTAGVLAHVSEWAGGYRLPLIGCGLLVIVGAFLRKKILPLPGFFLLAILFWLHPFQTLGALILVHNFIGYIFWILRSSTSADKKTAWGALIAFTLANAVIGLGALDTWLVRFQWFPESGFFSQIQLESLGLMIAPHSQEPMLWMRLLCLYALGQSMHYFVWLKALPDLALNRQVPLGFRESVKKLQNHYGKHWLEIFVGACLVMTSLGVLIQWTHAREFYFALAAFHGYQEIAILFLSFGKKDRTPCLSIATCPTNSSSS